MNDLFTSTFVMDNLFVHVQKTAFVVEEEYSRVLRQLSHDVIMFVQERQILIVKHHLLCFFSDLRLTV